MKEILYKLTYSDLKILQRIIEYSKRGSYPDIRELGLQKKDILHLIRLGVVEVYIMSRTYFVVKVRDDIVQYVKEVLDEKMRELNSDIIDSVLNIEYLYVKPELKDLLKKVILGKGYLLIVGKSGIGKTEILKALSRLPRSAYFSGVMLKKSDLIDLYKEPYLELVLINELDKTHSNAVYDILIDMFDEGRFCVIATANDIRKFPEGLKSRFIVYRLDYTLDEIISIIELVLRNKYGIHDVNIDIIKRLYHEYGDIRQVVERYRLGLV
jgi:hypothetical protein